MTGSNFLLPRVTRQTFHVTHSLRMFSQLPEQFEKTRYRGGQPFPGQDLMQSALQESWLIHARLLIEFLGIEGNSRGRDFNAAMFGWEPPAGNYEDLKEVWRDASRHLVHFSKEREPEEGWTNTRARYDVGRMAAVGEQVLALFGQLVEAPGELLDTVRAQYTPEVERACARIADLADLREGARLETLGLQARIAAGLRRSAPWDASAQ